jgi:hypothetical protein
MAFAAKRLECDRARAFKRSTLAPGHPVLEEKEHENAVTVARGPRGKPHRSGCFPLAGARVNVEQTAFKALRGRMPTALGR